MNWEERREAVLRQLPPEVARFLRSVLASLEEENVFDAPGLISGVLRRMRAADSDLVRAYAGRTEALLHEAFSPPLALTR